MAKMSDRRGYEADDLKKMAKAVRKKGGEKRYEKLRSDEGKDYRKDVKDYDRDRSSGPSGSMCRRHR